MEQSRVNVKLHRIPERIAKEEGYTAIVSSSETVSFAEFAKEVVEQNGFRMTPRMMQIYLEAAMETMIDGILTDGRPRRFGDYFTLGIKICGHFANKSGKFDKSNNKLMLHLRPLKGLKDRSFSKLSVHIDNLSDPVELTSISSVSTPNSPYVNYEEDFIVKGKNLVLSEDAVIDVAMTAAVGAGAYNRFFYNVKKDVWKLENGELRFFWKKLLSIDSNDKFRESPCQLMVRIKTRGADPAANFQKRTIRTFFAQYHEMHPTAVISKYGRPLK